jgi:transcription elongation factor Elf1
MQLGPHRLEEIREGKNRYHCATCGQSWTREPRSTCPGVPTYSRWAEVPEGFYSMTRMRLEFRRQTDWDRPHAAVRQLKAPYLFALYDINRCEPIPLSAIQQSAAEKRRQTLHDKWTCWLCGKYHRHRWQQKQFHSELQMCHGCFHNIDLWNKQIAWAKERIAENAQIAVFEYVPAARVADKGTLRNVEILRLDGTPVPQPEPFDPDAFFTTIMQVRTIYQPHRYDALYYVCPDQQRYPMWETRSDFEFGVPLVRRDGKFVNVTWHFGQDIYRRVPIPDPYLHLCQLWRIVVDEQAGQAEKMRRVILKVAEQEPLEQTAPPAAEKAS